MTFRKRNKTAVKKVAFALTEKGKCYFFCRFAVVTAFQGPLTFMGKRSVELEKVMY